jgi:hypothetical protein
MDSTLLAETTAPSLLSLVSGPSTFFFSYFASPSPHPRRAFFLEEISSDSAAEVTQAATSPEREWTGVAFFGCNSAFPSLESAPPRLFELLE